MGEQAEDGCGELGLFEVQAGGAEGAGLGIEGTVENVSGDYVGGVGIGVAEEVGEGYGWEGVGVGAGGVVEFDHCVVEAWEWEWWCGFSLAWRVEV